MAHSPTGAITDPMHFRQQLKLRSIPSGIATSIALFLVAFAGLGCHNSSSSNAFNGNNAPTATAVAPVTTAEDTPTGAIVLTGTDVEDAVGALTVNVSSAPGQGTLDVSTGTAPLSVVYTPNMDFVGNDTFNFTVTDSGTAVSAAVTVSITVTGLNDAPSFETIGTQVAVATQAFSFTPVVTDPDAGASLTFSSTGVALPAWTTFDTATGEISGTPMVGDVATTTGVRITVTDGIAAPVNSNVFTLRVVASPPTQIVYDTAPQATETAGAAWTPFTVRVENASNALVDTSSVDVTITLTSGSSTLGGTTTRQTFSGIATFDDLTYNIAEDITFDVTATGLTGITGTAMTITHGAANQLAFGTQPASIETVGTIFSAFTLEVHDAFGNLVLGDNSTECTIGLASGTGTLGGLLNVTASGGVANFGDITYSRAEMIALRGSSTPPLMTIDSGSINVQADIDAGLEIERADVRDANTESNGDSFAARISQSGRFVTFESDSTSLINGDANGQRDVFLRDRRNSLTTLVSYANSGLQSTAPSLSPDVSANGRYVVFSTTSANMTNGDTNGVSDIFLRDLLLSITSRVSVSTAGALADGPSSFPSVSADGRMIAFESTATNLVAGDTNGVSDIFVHDQLLGTTVRVSEATGAVQANGASHSCRISADGSTVVFVSDATNLVAGDTNAVGDIFHHSLASGTTLRVSVDSSSAEADAASDNPEPSADGRFVCFESLATNLVAGDTNAVGDIFLRDITRDSTLRISVDSMGVQADAANTNPSISGDGRFVTYTSDATNLVSGDTNGNSDIFLFDRLSDSTERISVDAAGAQSNGDSLGCAISSDGRYTCFESDATNLTSDDTNGLRDIFVVPNTSGGGSFPEGSPIVRNSVDSSGAEANFGSNNGAPSFDGRFVAFESAASNLVAGDTNLQFDIFVHDAATGVVERVSLTTAGAEGIAENRFPAISGDGRYIAFESLAPLVGSDTNGRRDIYMYDRVANDVERVSVDGAGAELSGHSFSPSISADGRFVAFETLTDFIAGNDTNGRRDIYVRDRKAGTTSLASQSDGGVVGNQDSFAPDLSPDGTYVAFVSRATNLVTGDTTSNRDIFVRNLATKTTVRVSLDSSDNEADGNSFNPVISADGQSVAFESDATNLVTSDTNGVRDIFVRSVLDGTTVRVSVDSMGAESFADSTGASISDDGQRVLFETVSGNLIAGDTNAAVDIFLRNLTSNTTTRVSVDAMSMQASGDSLSAQISGNGAYGSFESDASDLIPADTNGQRDIFTVPIP